MQVEAEADGCFIRFIKPFVKILSEFESLIERKGLRFSINNDISCGIGSNFFNMSHGPE